MPRLPSWILLFLAAATVRADPPALLARALQKVVDDRERWAYTQTAVWRDGRDRVLNTTVLRVDPSQPYERQYVPLSINGRPPTAAEIQKYRALGERHGRALEKAENAGRPPPGRSLGDLVELDRAAVVSQDAATVIYEVPLRADNNERFPPDKFQVLIAVDRQSQSLRHVSAHLRAPWRKAVVLNVKSGELDVDFAAVDAKHNPAMTAIRGDGRGSVLFLPLGRSYEQTRADFKHVRPFDERFGVKIGPIKALDF
ncbi:MAG TPA: hypothetical protein VHC86_00685 [Opitutaceae bacterium]|nr:hypothetical protein [Opitutaceae bacterium]